MYNNLLNYVRTGEEVNLLYNELDQLKQSVYSTDSEAFEKTLKSKVRKSISSALNEVIDPDNKIDSINKISTLLGELKVISITLAFEPTEQILNDLFSWIVNNLGAGYVLDIFHETSIIGGAIISFEGRYIDLSLERKISDESV